MTNVPIHDPHAAEIAELRHERDGCLDHVITLTAQLRDERAIVRRVEALIAHARLISPSGLMNIRVDDLEAAILGKPPTPAREGMIADDQLTSDTTVIPHPKEDL